MIAYSTLIVCALALLLCTIRSHYRAGLLISSEWDDLVRQLRAVPVGELRAVTEKHATKCGQLGMSANEHDELYVLLDHEMLQRIRQNANLMVTLASLTVKPSSRGAYCLIEDMQRHASKVNYISYVLDVVLTFRRIGLRFESSPALGVAVATLYCSLAGQFLALHEDMHVGRLHRLTAACNC